MQRRVVVCDVIKVVWGGGGVGAETFCQSVNYYYDYCCPALCDQWYLLEFGANGFFTGAKYAFRHLTHHTMPTNPEAIRRAANIYIDDVRPITTIIFRTSDNVCLLLCAYLSSGPREVCHIKYRPNSWWPFLRLLIGIVRNGRHDWTVSDLCVGPDKTRKGPTYIQHRRKKNIYIFWGMQPTTVV